MAFGQAHPRRASTSTAALLRRSTRAPSDSSTEPPPTAPSPSSPASKTTGWPALRLSPVTGMGSGHMIYRLVNVSFELVLNYSFSGGSQGSLVSPGVPNPY